MRWFVDRVTIRRDRSLAPSLLQRITCGWLLQLVIQRLQVADDLITADPARGGGVAIDSIAPIW